MVNVADVLTADEGLRLVVYDDKTGLPIGPGSKVEGNPTIGIGRCISSRNGITKAEALYLLQNDLAKEHSLLQGYPWYAGLDPIRQDVIVCMTFQMGLTGLLAFQWFITCLAAKNWVGAKSAMLDSLWAKETPARAGRLAAAILTGSF